MRAYAVGVRGFLPLLARELAAIGAKRCKIASHGVLFEGSWEEIFRANLELRTAQRILVHVAEASCSSAPEGEQMFQLARAVPWWRWLTPEDRIRVDLALRRRQPLRDAASFVVLRIKDGLCDAMRAQLGARPSVDRENPSARIVGFINDRKLALFLDSSGKPLAQRGFKPYQQSAPVKEHLAAAILMHLGWRADEPLLDPMCGSGTFLLEAALLAYGVAPGLLRSFACEQWVSAPKSRFDELRAEARKRLKAARHRAGSVALFGADLEAAAIETSRANWERLQEALGFRIPVAFAVEAAEKAAAPINKPGLWLANLPYGVRLARPDAAWYQALAENLKRSFRGWRVAMLSQEHHLERLLGLAVKRRTPLEQGSLLCTLYQFQSL